MQHLGFPFPGFQRHPDGADQTSFMKPHLGHNLSMQKENHRTRVATERRDRMRRRLFESAMQLVARQGPAATSIDDVIKAAEVSRGTFYKYFNSPDALFDQLALEVTKEIIRMTEPAVMHLNDMAERVAVGMRLVIHVGMSNREIAAFLVRLGWPEPLGRAVMPHFVKRDLEQGLRAGRFVAMPMSLALNIVSMTVLGSVHAMLALDAPPNFAEQAVASTLRALGIDIQEATRIATMELPMLTPPEGGLFRAPTARKPKL